MNNSSNESFLDIGANIGIYSLYAARKGLKVIAVEPDALNYAMLNLNIRVNNFGKIIMPYCIAIHDKEKFSSFNINWYEWGGAHNSFDNTLNQVGDKYIPEHSQGIFGISLDSFIQKININPNHIKIDVDGNENLIINGAHKLLENKSLLSILIELNEDSNDYNQTILSIKRFS